MKGSYRPISTQYIMAHEIIDGGTEAAELGLNNVS